MLKVNKHSVLQGFPTIFRFYTYKMLSRWGRHYNRARQSRSAVGTLSRTNLNRRCALTHDSPRLLHLSSVYYIHRYFLPSFQNNGKEEEQEPRRHSRVSISTGVNCCANSFQQDQQGLQDGTATTTTVNVCSYHMSQQVSLAIPLLFSTS
jgi:hypothetical protein